MKKTSNILWGALLIAAGVLFALNALGITDINIFFDGWWTLFLIVPCTIGLLTERDKTGNLIGIAIGVFLLLCCQDVLDFSLLWKLLVPAIIVIIGVRLIVGGINSSKAGEVEAKMKAEGRAPRQVNATFSGQDVRFDGEVFDGAELTAVFGGVECDLRQAIIGSDCVIQVSAIFGGIDIRVPQNVNVKVSTNAIFGGTSNKTPLKSGAPTVYITGICLFGGVDIK